MTIAAVSKKFEIPADTLRYYERIGLLPPVHRNKSGIRDFDEEDCRWVEFIKCMRGAGMPIEALIEYVALFRRGDETAAARKELLVEQRKLLMARREELTETIDRLTGKIDSYAALVEKEQELRKSADRGKNEAEKTESDKAETEKD